MLVNKDHSLDAAADTHPNSYLHIKFFLLIGVKPKESKTIHQRCGLVESLLFSIRPSHLAAAIIH